MIDAEVTLTVLVTDENVAIETARAKYMEDCNASKEEAIEAIPTISEALRWMFDPGESPPGLEIQDSSVTLNSPGRAQ